MTIETINLGNYANDGTGDDLREAFRKVNANFNALTGTVNIIDGANLTGGVGVFAQKNLANLEFKSLTSTDDSLTITSTATTVNLKANPHIVEDTNPALGGNLDLGSHYIYHGDVQTTVYGIEIPILNSLVELMLTSNQINVDLGAFLNPVTTTLNMGEFIGTYNFPNNHVDFGTFV